MSVRLRCLFVVIIVVIFLACYLVDHNSFVFVLFVLENLMLLHEGNNLQLGKQAHSHTRAQFAINHSVTLGEAHTDHRTSLVTGFA